MHIRDATPPDAAAIAALIRRTLAEVNARDDPPEVVTRLVRSLKPRLIAGRIGRWLVLVAEERIGGETAIVGTVALEASRMRMLFVRPDRQGEGTGGRLLARIFEIARDRGVAELEVASSVSAEGFYRRHGFVSRGAFTDRGQRVVLMRVPLGAQHWRPSINDGGPGARRLSPVDPSSPRSTVCARYGTSVSE